MSKESKKSFWQNRWVVGTGSIVIGTAILKILDWLSGTQLVNFLWNFIKSIFLGAFSFVGWTFEIPIWGITLIFLSGIGLLFIWAWFNNKIEELNSEQEPKFLNYTEDEFDNILYKWEYELNYDDKYSPTNFTPFCPDDNCILHYGKCPICNRNFNRYFKDNSELEKIVIHKIQNDLIEESEIKN